MPCPYGKLTIGGCTSYNVESAVYLAIRAEVYAQIFSEPIGQVLLEKKRFKLIVFDSLKETIIRWID
ncbi:MULTISPECIES: element excision factor XisH family protein [unclassified Microcoleus]|uniref:element excision factor XisH family protein n=1 Tax=unclassified Microcoleus TaxID=2642155 RepID=UPI002FCF4833